ncbi:DUF5996 family protein [Streptomyces nigra]|uniref:DUF5996 family protein n=1 Tax=Streptomyces sp. JHA19 TaxID=1577588 RepID=UPI0006E1A585|nr:DUF5996 family protein [Streptomyces sp. JHA19]
MAPAEFAKEAAWPRLLVDEWTETRETLHMWVQIVGKVRLACAPLVNHWWQVTLYVTPRGLTTSGIPYGSGLFDIEFDFTQHTLVVRTSEGGRRDVALRSMPVMEFHARLMSGLFELGVPVEIQNHPNETEVAIDFTDDFVHRTYDPHAVHLFWQQLVQAHRGMTAFRSYFAGKVSPVHFFWGAMDLACTRFSGRRAPAHPGGAPHCGDWVMVEGYSHELSSCGFWPGGGEEGAFYSYAYPEPEGFSLAPVVPEAASYSREHGQFLLPYEAVRQSADPDATLAAFLHSTYDAAADGGRWDRSTLETDPRRWASRQR